MLNYQRVIINELGFTYVSNGSNYHVCKELSLPPGKLTVGKLENHHL